MIILLDSEPLGLITNPKFSAEADACNRWVQSVLLTGAEPLIPEMVDYEIRRELLRADKLRGIERHREASAP